MADRVINYRKIISRGEAYIPDHYNHSLAIYQTMVEVARLDFPDLTPEQVDCMTVTGSGYCDRMPVIRFNIPLGTTKPGLGVRDELDFYLA